MSKTSMLIVVLITIFSPLFTYASPDKITALPWLHMLLFVKPPLLSISISGPTQVNGNSGAQYTCTALYSDDSTFDITNSVTWSENTPYAIISNTGNLTTGYVPADTSATITATYLGKSATQSILLRKVPPPLYPSVAVLVDPSIEGAIQDELSVFVSDLSNDGLLTTIHSVTESTPPQLRSYLQGLYNDPAIDLVGAILIGSVPTPRYYIYYPAAGQPQRGPWNGASYQYYEDLDGDFQLRDTSQWLYDDHTGDVESEIWISVLPPLASYDETIPAIQQYFLKNHRYRLGLERPAAGYLHPVIGSQLETEEQYNYQVDNILGLVPPGSYQYSYGPLNSRGNILVAPNNLLNDPVNFPGSDEVFYQEIQTGDYDILISSAHGSEYGIGSNGYWYDRSYLNNNLIDVTFWFEAGCSTANLDVVPSFGVTALYSETSKVLAYRGATMPQGGLGASSNGLYRFVLANALSNGETIGEAILEHRSMPMVDNYASQREYFAAQHILLGDGTLRLQEHQLH